MEFLTIKLTFEASQSTLSPEIVEQFKVAVKSNDHKTLIRLFMLPGSINYTFEEKEGDHGRQSVRTPLDWTAQYGSKEMLAWLIKLGASDSKFIFKITDSFNACQNVIFNYVIKFLEDLKASKKSLEEIEQFRNMLVVFMNLQVSGPVYNELCITLGQSLLALSPEVTFEGKKEITAIFFLNAKKYDHEALLNILADMENIPADNRTEDRIGSANCMLKAVAKVFLYKVRCLTARHYIDEQMIELFYQENKDPITLMWHISRWYVCSQDAEKKIDLSNEEAEVREIMILFEKFMANQQVQAVTADRQDEFYVKELSRRLSGTFANPAQLSPSTLLLESGAAECYGK